MAETLRLLEAAAALSRILTAGGISHAFHGSILISLLSKNPQCPETLCIVEGTAGTHPFGRVRQAVEGSDALTATNQPLTNRLHVTYHVPIPPVIIEILPAGEEGPRKLDETTVSIVQGLPFLSTSEFIRAKIRAWLLRSSEHDAQDIIWALNRYWKSVDINRIPDQDMERFVLQYPAAGAAWTAIKSLYSA